MRFINEEPGASHTEDFFDKLREQEENKLVATSLASSNQPLELSETVQRYLEYYFGEEE